MITPSWQDAAERWQTAYDNVKADLATCVETLRMIAGMGEHYMAEDLADAAREALTHLRSPTDD